MRLHWDGQLISLFFLEVEKNDTKRPKIRLSWPMKTGASAAFRASFLPLTTTEWKVEGPQTLCLFEFTLCDA